MLTIRNLEMSGADFAGAEMETMLGWPEVRGVAEVMDMHGVLHGSERMQEIVQAGLNSGKLIEGHARGLSGADLQAYLAAGVTSDHELTSADDALEKLRAGLTIEIRGSHPYLLPDIVAALKTLPHLSSQITVCTDDGILRSGRFGSSEIRSTSRRCSLSATARRSAPSALSDIERSSSAER